MHAYLFHKAEETGDGPKSFFEMLPDADYWSREGGKSLVAQRTARKRFKGNS
jgi:hypothetical protein